MAENAANISSLQHSKPNILELVAQESFMNSVYPAFRAICSYIANKNRKQLMWLEKWSDEAFLGTNILLQYYYLKIFNSSFSEAFYGLKRIHFFSENPKIQLTKKAIASSLLFLVIIPYINRILEKEREKRLDDPQSSSKNRVFNSLDKLRNYCGVICGSLKLYYLILYISTNLKVHDPLLKISGVKLVYQERYLPSWWDMIKTVCLNKPDSSQIRISFFFKLLGLSLEMGAFFIQFLNWWHSDGPKKISNSPLPEPPHINNGSDHCPLCHSKRKNEVVLSTSGYVFCYLCIKEYLVEKGICPVTHLPSSTENIVRIYSTNEI